MPKLSCYACNAGQVLSVNTFLPKSAESLCFRAATVGAHTFESLPISSEYPSARDPRVRAATVKERLPAQFRTRRASKRLPEVTLTLARCLAAAIFLYPALHAQAAQPPVPTTHAAQPTTPPAPATQPAPPAKTPPTQPPQPPAPANADTAAALQRASAAAMQESIAKQMASVQQQISQTSAASFFALPPPATLGATVAGPSSFAVFADCDPLPFDQVDGLIEDASKREHVEENVLRGVMRQESAFRPCAVSSKGAMGLMQLMPATADQYGVKHPFDPVENVEAGAKLLKDLLSRYGGDLTLALGAYNAGAAKVDAAAGVPNIQETQDYVQKIMSNLPAKQP